MPMRRWVPLALIATAMLALPPSIRADDAATVGPPPDCGTGALFVLLRIEGKPIALERLEAALGPRHTDGYSMAELVQAAGRLNLPLKGVRFGPGARPLDRSAIAYFRDAQAGHFAVLRPVGTTGTMVQVIDPPMPPRIVDYERLFTDTPWTGRVLVPRDPWAARAAWPLAVVAGLALVLTPVAARLRRRWRVPVEAP